MENMTVKTWVQQEFKNLFLYFIAGLLPKEQQFSMEQSQIRQGSLVFGTL